jgi:hypothetical protein
MTSQQERWLRTGIAEVLATQAVLTAWCIRACARLPPIPVSGADIVVGTLAAYAPLSARGA